MYKNIMVPLDGSKIAECVLPHVEGFVTDCQVENIIFVRVIEPISTSFSDIRTSVDQKVYEAIHQRTELIEKERKISAENYLKEIINRFKKSRVKYKIEVIFGRAAESLADYIDSGGIDLVLIATHGRSGISRWVRGSVADKVLRSSSAPVLMVRAEEKMIEEKI